MASHGPGLALGASAPDSAITRGSARRPPAASTFEAAGAAPPPARASGVAAARAAEERPTAIGPYQVVGELGRAAPASSTWPGAWPSTGSWPSR